MIKDYKKIIQNTIIEFDKIIKSIQLKIFLYQIFFVRSSKFQ